MIIHIGADHRGYALKERLKKMLADEGYAVVDAGAASPAADDDYPDFAKPVAEAVGGDPANHRGILICGSGFGMDMAANKFPGVRAALPMSPDHAFAARHDDDANVLSIAADFTDPGVVEQIVKTFLATPFAGDERYIRRIRKIIGPGL